MCKNIFAVTTSLNNVLLSFLKLIQKMLSTFMPTNKIFLYLLPPLWPHLCLKENNICSKNDLPFNIGIILRHFTAQFYTFTNIGIGILQAFGHQNWRIFDKIKLQIYNLREKTR